MKVVAGVVIARVDGADFIFFFSKTLFWIKTYSDFSTVHTKLLEMNRLQLRLRLRLLKIERLRVFKNIDSMVHRLRLQSPAYLNHVNITTTPPGANTTNGLLHSPREDPR